MNKNLICISIGLISAFIHAADSASYKELTNDSSHNSLPFSSYFVAVQDSVVEDMKKILKNGWDTWKNTLSDTDEESHSSCSYTDQDLVQLNILQQIFKQSQAQAIPFDKLGPDKKESIYSSYQVYSLALPCVKNDSLDLLRSNKFVTDLYQCHENRIHSKFSTLLKNQEKYWKMARCNAITFTTFAAGICGFFLGIIGCLQNTQC